MESEEVFQDVLKVRCSGVYQKTDAQSYSLASRLWMAEEATEFLCMEIGKSLPKGTTKANSKSCSKGTLVDIQQLPPDTTRGLKKGPKFRLEPSGWHQKLV